MDEAEDDVLAYMTFPKAHRTKWACQEFRVWPGD
jgi:hypothetical protein